TVQLVLKPNTILYRNNSIGIFNSKDLWHTPYGKDSLVQNMLINFNVPENGSKYATNIDLLTPMSWDAIEEWSESKIGKRPKEYELFKQKKAKECIALAQQYIPELQDNIEQIWTSTPLTYRDYTGTRGGSAYGIRKSCNNLLGTLLSPTTPFENLFLSGQNLILHGMQGVAMTTILTCNIICGKNILKQNS
ncbi:MAG: NAD(P)/FAD-dependent oxidoreductase, partial [Bacteroidales bacterium]|nr:NAD(P)/FAD-dependent oxidoreductase [Bacteroidales bacterium]